MLRLDIVCFKLRYPSLRRLFDVPTHLTDSERVSLFRLAREAASYRSSPSIVEIGSYVGASSNLLAAAIQRFGGQGRVYCVDTWANDAMTEGSRDTMKEFSTNTGGLSEWIVPIRGWSTKVVDDVKSKAGEIDLLFIDGDHSYESCLADWQAYQPLLSTRAIVVMHDIGWAEGVQRVVNENIRPLVTSEDRLPNMWWGWITK